MQVGEIDASDDTEASSGQLNELATPNAREVCMQLRWEEGEEREQNVN